jgi:hypothetical protein
LHKAGVAKAAEELKSEGFNEIKYEVYQRTPEGEKCGRFVDVQGKNTTKSEGKWVQVGKAKMDGDPISREQKAMDDLNTASGMDVIFRQYN